MCLFVSLHTIRDAHPIGFSPATCCLITLLTACLTACLTARLFFCLFVLSYFAEHYYPGHSMRKKRGRGKTRCIYLNFRNRRPAQSADHSILTLLHLPPLRRLSVCLSTFVCCPPLLSCLLLGASLSHCYPFWSQGKTSIDQLAKIFGVLGMPTEDRWPGWSKLPVVKKVSWRQGTENTLRATFPATGFR